MKELRPALRAYLLGVSALAATALTIGWVLGVPAADPIAALLLGGFAWAAQMRPLHLSSKLKIDVDDAPAFAIALVFDPAYAMLVAGVAMICSRIATRREPWYGHLFNVAVSVLAAGAASLTYRRFAGAGFTETDDLVAAVASALVLYAVRTALVDAVVALHLRRDPRHHWWRLHSRGLSQVVALYLLGGLAALLVEVQPWTLLLLILPVGLIHLSLSEVSRLRARTRAAIFEMADLLDQRDPYTHGHSQRVAEYAERVARHLQLPQSQTDLIRESARLHDLGKIGTPDSVLHKPASLAGHEVVAMQAHAEYGARILEKLPDFWEGAALVAAHHERNDGQGYPRGLRGHEIPLEVAIIAVADAYDAMATDRPYRMALTWPDILSELQGGRGSQWDAVAVDAFIEAMGPAASRSPRLRQAAS